MKEILLVGTGFSLIVVCCALMAIGDSLVFLVLSGSTWASLAGPELGKEKYGLKN